MSKLSRIGPNESSALSKLCNWSAAGLKAMMETISQYERYETKDVKPKGHNLALLRGEKMNMTNVLFKALAKVDESYFLAVYKDILADKCSLESCVKHFTTKKEVEKVSSVLIILAGYDDMEKLKQDHPEKFEFEQLELYIGAEVANGIPKNEQAKRLKKYMNSVFAGDGTLENDVQFIEYEGLANLAGDVDFLDKFETIVFLMNKESSKDFMTELIKARIKSEEETLATLISFPSEILQFEVLSLLRNAGKDLKIFPLLFHGNSCIIGDVAENLTFCVLFGRFSVLSPPLSLFQSSISNLLNVVEKISPPYSSVAQISDLGFVKVHCESLTRKVTYFGLREEMMKMEASLKKRSKKGFLKSDEDRESCNQNYQDEEVEGADINITSALAGHTTPVQGERVIQPSRSRFSYQEEMDNIGSELEATTDCEKIEEKIEEIDDEIDKINCGKIDEIEDKIDGVKIKEIEDKIYGEKMEEKGC